MTQCSAPINGARFSFEPGQTILPVAEENPIPTLCCLKDAAPARRKAALFTDRFTDFS